MRSSNRSHLTATGPARSDGRRRTWTTAFVLASVAALVGLSAYLRISARSETEIARGEWELQFDQIPAWFPPRFEGALRELAQVPRRVSLQSSSWYSRLSQELEANPWIARVTHMEREGAGVRFRADFVRPVVAVQVRGGFLLCDSQGRGIDVQPGAGVDPTWQVPTYRPEGGLHAAPPYGSPLDGTILAKWEARELFGLLTVLWDGGIYERWAADLVRLNTRNTSEGDRLWLLVPRRGPRLDWGRSPASDRVPELSVERKLQHLQRTLRHFGELSEVPEVRLWEPAGPLVGVAPR